MLRKILSSLCLLISTGSTTMFHLDEIANEWKIEEVPAFDELMLSWNAPRPQEGSYQFYVSLFTEEWSDFLLYATWGSEGQKSFSHELENSSIRVYQDAVEVLKNKKATGFRIQVKTEKEANLEQIYHLHVYTNADKDREEKENFFPTFIQLEVPGISQMLLDHLRKQDLCSPTSTTAVTRFLSQKFDLNPLEFASKSWDAGFDIFGNWVFNVAQSSVELGPQWSCWVERCHGFQDIYEKLQQSIPTVVSVRGPLKGSAAPYAKGHLIAVIGYDPENGKVLCMDSAFPSDESTHVSYDLTDFMAAWNRRGKIAYRYEKSFFSDPSES